MPLLIVKLLFVTYMFSIELCLCLEDPSQRISFLQKK
jgi:hypothetical protein